MELIIHAIIIEFFLEILNKFLDSCNIHKKGITLVRSSPNKAGINLKSIVIFSNNELLSFNETGFGLKLILKNREKKLKIKKTTPIFTIVKIKENFISSQLIFLKIFVQLDLVIGINAKSIKLKLKKGLITLGIFIY
ncbi:hypothetical protein [Clostridium perfringens]|uniref:hypothetical protein n=1 Tax=Clostridium perfringens TaxID=1502 RepID=UPI001FD86DB8|nr:hypothetical protein [Clostridium perfringens]